MEVMRSLQSCFGWSRAYIETTGYIIPPCLILHPCSGSTSLENAISNGEWLLRNQTVKVALDMDYVEPLAFDTGQVLLGLQRLHAETKDDRYLVAAESQ